MFSYFSMRIITTKNSSVKTNGLVFKELWKRGYSIEGGNKIWNISDSKLWYHTSEQAQAFLDLETKDPKQKMFLNKEISLIKQKFPDLVEGVVGKSINLVDLGCGNGEKAAIFIKEFKDKSKIRYYPIDINKFMIDKAIKAVSRLKKVKILQYKNNLLDFFDFGEVSGAIKTGSFQTNYLLLLGGTLENSDVHELLHEIRSAMHEGDYLLIGNKLTHPSPAKMVKYYSSSKYIDNLVFKTIEQLGFKRDELEYGARFRGNRVEVFYTIKTNKTISSGKRKVDFNKGDKIIMLVSYKYTKDSLTEVLMTYFDDVEVFVSKDGIFSLALCKK